MSALFTNTPSQQNGKPLRATIMTTRIFHTLVLPIALAVLGGQANAASVTTYSAANGAWRLEQSALQPPLTLRARAGAAYADSSLEIEPGGHPSITLTLQKLTGPKAISERIADLAKRRRFRHNPLGQFQRRAGLCRAHPGNARQPTRIGNAGVVFWRADQLRSRC